MAPRYAILASVRKRQRRAPRASPMIFRLPVAVARLRVSGACTVFERVAKPLQARVNVISLDHGPPGREFDDDSAIGKPSDHFGIEQHRPPHKHLHRRPPFATSRPLNRILPRSNVSSAVPVLPSRFLSTMASRSITSSPGSASVCSRMITSASCSMAPDSRRWDLTGFAFGAAGQVPPP